MRSALQIVADHYAAAASGDLAAMLADLAPDVAWIEMAGSPCAGTHVGAAAVIDGVFAVIGRDWADFRFELERMIDGGSSVVALGDYLGTHRRTGRAMQARVVHVWDVADGQVRRFEQFCDTRLMDEATRPA